MDLNFESASFSHYLSVLDLMARHRARPTWRFKYKAFTPVVEAESARAHFRLSLLPLADLVPNYHVRIAEKKCA